MPNEGDYAYAVSFDPYAADSEGSNEPAKGVYNSAQFIPPGSYYIAYGAGIFEPPPIVGTSQIFAHSYTQSCSDFFNGSSERCAEYYFQIVTSRAPSCVGVGCFGPTPELHGGLPVIPIYLGH
jgi:hypothetical protein